jgi:transposase InsO family protein
MMCGLLLFNMLVVTNIMSFSLMSFPHIHKKSEVFTNFVKFKLLVENQFTSHIKQLQSDGGGEYNSVQFQTFLTKHGIVHRKTYPHTSQHNGLVERKLRLVLKTGLTLLAHSHLSNRYWVDAFLTAVCIINRLPTPTLQNKSPYLKLYYRDPDYKKLRFWLSLLPLTSTL